MVTKMCVAAANYIIEKVNNYNAGKPLRSQVFMTSKRLQKILFFADVLFMLENNKESMFSDEFYAWPSGPVIPSVYKEFMQYQDGEMQPHTEGNHAHLSEGMKAVLDRVINHTMTIDTSELIKTSHVEGGPWRDVYDEANDNVINKTKIYNYYVKHGAPYGVQKIS